MSKVEYEEIKKSASFINDMFSFSDIKTTIKSGAKDFSDHALTVFILAYQMSWEDCYGLDKNDEALI